MNAPLRLVIAEDYPPDVDLLLAELRRAGYDPRATVVDSRDAFIAALDSDPQVVLCDYTLPSMTAPDALQILGLRSPDLPLIVVSGTMDEAVCVTSLRLGAADYLLKDRLSRLGPAIEHALRRRELDLAAREAERERQETLQLLQDLVTELDAANAELRELDRLKTEFIASVSHELRTPLTSIRGYAELLLDAAPSEPGDRQARMLAVIDRNARRLLGLVEDLLMLSQMDASTLERSTETVDLAELAADARMMLEPTSRDAGVQVRIETDGPLPVEGERSQLERVLINLLSNAVKFSHAGGTVLVRGRVDGGDVVVSVADTGIGVSEQELPHLFTRFFRSANDEAHSIPGTGLGLAVVREIVEHHGGLVTMQSVLHQGSTVTVRVPRTGRPNAPAPAPGEPATSARAG